MFKRNGKKYASSEERLSIVGECSVHGTQDYPLYFTWVEISSFSEIPNKHAQADLGELLIEGKNCSICSRQVEFRSETPSDSEDVLVINMGEPTRWLGGMNLGEPTTRIDNTGPKTTPLGDLFEKFRLRLTGS
jgi:hypothetical protein